MKLSISNIAWPVANDEEMYAFLQEAGYNGLEIAPTRIYPESPYDRLLEAREWALSLKENYGLVIPSMQSIWFARTEKIFGTEQERQILIDYTKKAIDFAEAVCCNNLVFGNPKNRDITGVASVMPIAIDFFREIGDYAAAHNTIVALEPNPIIYKTHFINYTEQAVEMVDKVSSAGIKVNVDLGSIIYNKEDIDYLKKIPEYINHIHISEPGLNLIEKRELHKQLFAILKEIGYDRFVSIEMSNKGDLEKVKDVCGYLKGLEI